MSIGAVFVALLLAGLTVYAAALPFRRGRQTTGQVSPAASSLQVRLAGLEDQRVTLFAALADLDADHSLGKLNDEDYQMVRHEMMAQTVAVLRQLDAQAEDIDSQVEALVRARRAEMARSAEIGRDREHVRCLTCDAAARPDDRFCARCGAELDQGCPRCGAGIKPGDLFCARCGSTLAVGAATA